MPKFYFDFDDGINIELDSVGIDFPNRADAISDADRALDELFEGGYLAVVIREEGFPPFEILTRGKPK